MSEEKKMAEEKRYAIVTRDSMRMYAEAGGHMDLADDVAGMLGEDLSYRLRTIAQIGAQFMRHAKRRRLTTEDMNKALNNMDVQPILGHGSLEPQPFRQTRDGDIHFVEDHDVNFSNIATNSYIPKNTGNTSIKGHWLAVEGVPKQSTSHQQSQSGQASQGKPPLKFGSKVVTEELLSYYNNITKAILGSDEQLMKIALKDLRTNSKIVRLLPYFVNFVSNGVKTVSHDITQLTKLLHTVKSLTSNKYLYLQPKPYLTLLVQAVMYCVLETLAASINPLNDHWVLRDYAARLLAQIISRWNTPINQLRQNALRTLKEALYDINKPFCSHYGAVMGLLALGCQSIEDSLIPHLNIYWPHLQAVMGDNSKTNALFKTDAHKVYGAILLAVELLIKQKLHEFESQCAKNRTPLPMFNMAGTQGVRDSANRDDVPTDDSPSDHTQTNVCQFYQQMYEYFGDDLAMRLPKLNLQRIFKPSKKEVLVSLRDQEMDGKSGEELLEEFMEQVRLQQIREEEERKIRQERERLMEIERQKQLIKQRELQRLEQERRAKEAEIRRRHEAELQRRQQEEMRLYELERQRMENERRHQQELERQRLELEYQERAMHQALAFQQSRHAAYAQRTSHDMNVASVVEDYDVSEEEQDVDVENTSDRSPASDAKSDYKSDREEDATGPAFYGEDPSQMDLTVRTTVDDPQGGIKLTISKRPKMKISKHVEKADRSDRGEKHKDKESKHSKKRKQSQKSPRETQRSPRGDPDKYDLGDVKRKADLVYQFDGGDYVSKPKSSYTKRPSHRGDVQEDVVSYERMEEERMHTLPRVTLKLSKSKLKEASAAQASPDLHHS